MLIASLLLTAIILVLSLVVLLARQWLGFSGTATVSIDDGRVMEVAAGRRLLWALADEGIYLPAACGGKGACGQCRVRVLKDCPELSLMGAEHINPPDAAAGYRLACMVRVWNDLAVSVESELRNVGHWDCEVVSNRNISVYLKELILRLPDRERLEFEAGDYVQVMVPPYQLLFRNIDIDAPYDKEWAHLGLFALESAVTEPTVRAYSFANPPRQDREIHLVVRIATPPASAPVTAPPGRASSYLFSLREGDRLAVSGPYGSFHATENDSEMIFMAGGAGIAPIRSLILDQFSRPSPRRMSLWFGARDLNDLVYFDEFERLADAHDNFSIQAVLSNPLAGDQWAGETGFLHAVVHERYLKTHPAPGEAEYYLCGPPLMTAAVLQMLDNLGVAATNILLDDFGS
jgi:Na+-transporting NADH:ubiquinone oxidoreductase subunit F